MPDERALPLPVRLLLDAEDAILRAAEAIPAPGREGHLGPLSAPGGVMAHVAWTHDLWSGQFIGGLPAQARKAQPDDTGYREGIEAFRTAAARVRPSLVALGLHSFPQPAHFDGTRFPGEGSTKGYMILRGIAHLFTHAGDLTVAGSLVGMPDLSLPGPLARCQAVVASDTTATSLVPLLLDGLDEVRRVADALPVPAQVGAFARLNAGSFIVAHVVAREDLLWNVGTRGRPRDPWLEAANVGPAAPRSVPAWDDAREALDRIIEGITPHLESLSATDLVSAVEYRGAHHMTGAQLARSAAHVFYHAGELQALGSLAGMPDLDLPGALARCAQG